jgi:hypothetical protein
MNAIYYLFKVKTLKKMESAMILPENAPISGNRIGHDLLEGYLRSLSSEQTPS